tara:strand:- start:1738 stop:2097 length:360 start_codon:yes stop_codon:yes gene_type:complete
MAITFTEHHDRAMMVVKATIAMTGASDNATTTHSYYGFLVQCVIDETDAPTDGYDIVVTDEFLQVDLLNGKGANLSGDTTITQADLDNGMACSGQLKVTTTDGESGKDVDVYLYIARYQ